MTEAQKEQAHKNLIDTMRKMVEVNDEYSVMYELEMDCFMANWGYDYSGE